MEQKEVTIKEIVQKLLGFWKLIRGHIKKLVITGLLGGILLIFVAYLTPKQYEAVSTVFLKSGGGGSASMLGGLASQFGLGGLGGGEIDEDKFLAIGVSRSVIKQTLCNKVNLNGREDMMINFVLSDLKLDETWEDEESTLKGFKIRSTNANQFTYVEDSVFISLHEILNEEYISLSSSKEGIISATNRFFNDSLSKLFNEIWVEEMSQYFIEKNVSKTKNELGLVQNQVDSIYDLLKNKEVQLAEIKDSKSKVVKFKGYVDEFRLRREIEMLSLMFAEGIKNLEIAKYSLRNQTPVVDLIDRPRLPLEEKKKSKAKSGILGGILGGFIGILIFVIIPIVRIEIKKLNSDGA